MKKNKGQCYRRSLDKVLNERLAGRQFHLVHSIAVGQGDIEGSHHGHAFTEFRKGGQWWVWDAVTEETWLRDEYYAEGQITYAIRYTAKTAAKLASTLGTTGPWDETIAAAVHTKANPKNWPMKKAGRRVKL